MKPTSEIESLAGRLASLVERKARATKLTRTPYTFSTTKERGKRVWRVDVTET